jgi:hypothetical protein
MKPSLMLVALCLTTSSLNAQYENSGLTEFTQRSQANNDAFRAQQEAAVQQQKANDSLQNIQWQQQQQLETLQQIRNQRSSTRDGGGAYGDAMAGAFALMHDARENIRDEEGLAIAAAEENRRQRQDKEMAARQEHLDSREQDYGMKPEDASWFQQKLMQLQSYDEKLATRLNADALQSKIKMLDDKAVKSNFKSSNDLYAAFSPVYLDLIKDGSTSFLPSIPTNDALGMGKAVWDFAHSNHPGASSAREGCITIMDEKTTTPIKSPSPN